MTSTKNPRENILKKSEDIEGISIKGPWLDKDIELKSFIKSFKSIGFQASHLGIAIDIVREMRKERATIFMSYTSNMVSSGLREIIAWLVKHKYIDVLVTSGGGIEEDIIKSYKPFILGSFYTNDVELREKGINRIGNILVPNDRYIWFESFMQEIFDKVLELQRERGKPLQPSEIIKILGENISDEHSVLYWAARNNIPIYCPPFLDGSLGDMYYFYKQNHPEIDIAMGGDHKELIDRALNAEKLGLIILGGATPKHQVINAALFRGGADYAVYLSTGTEYDGSLSGAKPTEGMSWGKINKKARAIFIEGDATITFPLLVIGGFID